MDSNELRLSVHAAVARRLHDVTGEAYAEAVIDCLVTLTNEAVHVVCALAQAAAIDGTALMAHLTRLMEVSLREQQQKPTTWH